MRAVVVAVIVLALTGVADAGAWYYTWNCAGGCAPNQLAISGVNGPFGSEGMCNDARRGDPRRQEVIAPGNAGWVSSCEESDSAPAAADGSPSKAIVTQRYSLNVLGGRGWTVRDAMGDTAGLSTFGIDLRLVGGPRPWIGLEGGLGIQRAPIRSPRWTGEVNMLVIPWTIGFASSPGIIRAKSLELRFDFGAAIAFLFRASCDECNTADVSSSAYVWVLRGGVDIYPRAARTPGIGIHAVMWRGKQGSLTDETAMSAIEIIPPTFFIEVSLLGRNERLAW